MKEFRILLCYPLLLLLFILISISFDYPSASAITPVYINGQVLTQDTDITSYENSSVGMGEGNTNEGFRLESNSQENRQNTPESELLKIMSTKNGFKLHSRHYGYISFHKHSVIDASIDKQAFHKQFLI